MKTSETIPIQSLFEPQSFAVIGASYDEKKIGHTIVKNLISGGYQGKIYPVNPQGGRLLGHDVYSDITEIKEPVDMASIVIPAEYTVEAVRKCAEAGVKNIQIITSGFSEVGNHADEDEIVRIANESGMRVLGPNIFGMFFAKSSMNSTFSATDILPGNVAILTQSGALGIAMIGKTAVDKIGLSAIVSLGNKCDVDEGDLLQYLITDEQTKVILMYIEGVRNGDKLIPVLKEATKVKPIIVIKSGSSKRGAMAAASHTGSLAGADNIFDAIMRQCGVLRAKTLEEAFSWAKFLSVCPEPKGNRSVIVTNGGGIGVLATDACENYGIELFDDQGILRDVFGPATPSYGSTKNPVDITGGAKAKDYDLALSAPATSEYMDATMALYCETATFDSENLAPMIRETYDKHQKAGKPISYAIVGGRAVEDAIVQLRKDNIPVFNDVDPAVSCLGAAYKYFKTRKEIGQEPDIADIDVDRINSIIDKVLADDRKFLLANEAQDVMDAADIPIPQSRIARNLDEAVKYAEEMGYPLVMKVVSRDIVHKSDAGGLALGLDNKEEVIDAFEAIMQKCKAYKPDADIEGVELAEMVQEGLEIVAGAIRDPAFGPVVMCGLGGIYVEVMKDVSFRAFPLNKKETMGMLEEIRSYPLLLGVRGEERKDINGMIDIIIKLGTILYRCDRISDIEINPVVLYEESRGLKALDVRILLKKSKEEQ